MRNVAPPVATSMDGVTENVKEYLRDKFANLYNSANDTQSLIAVDSEIRNQIGWSDCIEAQKITPSLSKDACVKLRSGKSDPSFLFSSDCLKHAPQSLYESLSMIVRSFLLHGHVTQILLLGTLVPIIEDKLGSITSSKNYRSIAISSLILKIIDWVFLLLYGSSFNLSDLQFAYQAGCSTTMCTWAVLETVDYFMKNGSEVYTCAMDMTKAFDLTPHTVSLKNCLLSPNIS